MKQETEYNLYLSIGEVAKILNQPKTLLQQWDNNGTFSASKKIDGARYYHQDEVFKMKGLLSGVTRKEAAKYLGVTQKTMWYWDLQDDTKHPHSKYCIGKTRYYTQYDLDQYLNAKGGTTHEDTTL